MDKSKIYLDLSKCTEEEIKEVITKIFSSDFPVATLTRHILENMMVHKFNGTPYLLINEFDHWKLNKTDMDKTELTYPEFIKLFEGGEGEKPIDLNISKEDFIFSCNASRQNLNGRENEQEIFLAGIESVIEELNIKFNSK